MSFDVNLDKYGDGFAKDRQVDMSMNLRCLIFFLTSALCIVQFYANYGISHIRLLASNLIGSFKEYKLGFLSNCSDVRRPISTSRLD